MNEDPRSRRVVVISDDSLASRIAELRDSGFGVMQLPPTELARDVAAAWLDQTAEQIAELLRSDYEVMLADGGAWAAELDDALAAVGVAPLPRLAPTLSSLSEPLSSCTEWAPSPRRVRVVFGGETVAESTRMMLLRQHGFLPVYYFPADDVRLELLEPSEHTTYSPYKGTASYWSVRVGDRSAPSTAWSYLDPNTGSPDTRGFYSFDFHSMDAWFEEDEQIFVHARDPFHRVDALRSSRHVRVEIDGTVVADSTRPVLLFETSLVTRYYLPREDVREELFEPSATYTMCPYKGRAGYVSVRIGETLHEDAAWTYPMPLPDVARIENHLCFWNERYSIEVDGARLPTPIARAGVDGGETLEPKRLFFGVPPPASMLGAKPGALQHDFARSNGRAEGPPLQHVDIAVERAGGPPTQ